MDKEEIAKALKDLYERALIKRDFALCLEIMKEIIAVSKIIEIVSDDC